MWSGSSSYSLGPGLLAASSFPNRSLIVSSFVVITPWQICRIAGNVGIVDIDYRFGCCRLCVLDCSSFVYTF